MVSGPRLNIEKYTSAIFRIGSDHDFNGLALELFHHQYWNNPLYREYCDLLGFKPGEMTSPMELPFLPVEFFRDRTVLTGKADEGAKVFVSSGTTASLPGRHIVSDPTLYEKSFTHSFRHFYGDPRQYCFLALLPGYLERPDSSLVYMMDYFIRLTRENGSGFYLDDLDSLVHKISEIKPTTRKIILFGVTFALLDLAERHTLDLEGAVIMETGGMKGRRTELVREELHQILCPAFNIKSVHSEYGMTELLSQAWSKGEGIFRSPPWMKVIIRDLNDPLSLAGPGDTGGINIIDLANVHSCGFIATQDLGRLHDDGSFEVMGRFDNSDIRGCSLMVG